MIARRAPAKAALLGAAFLFVAAGCATTDLPGGSRADVETWAASYGLVRVPLRTAGFDLFALARQSSAAETLSIYIEGDGAPWAGLHHPPRDPTPLSPIALALAAADGAPALAWLARPCQYLDAPVLAGCDIAYWTGRRFAPEVVAAYDAAVTQLKARSGARRVRLIGHSGGGVISVLVAARRGDVERVITVAAPLAVADWVAWHRLSPLAGSLDPRREAGDAPAPPGVHFAGASDQTVPAAIVEGYVRARGGRLETLAGFDHDCCWAREWPQLLHRALR